MSAEPRFYLFIDEAGDEGIGRVRPTYPDGASEYFVLAGVLISASRLFELHEAVRKTKLALGLSPDSEIHFRDLDDQQQRIAIDCISKFRMGVVCVASNKSNLIGYRNLRVEATILEQVKSGRLKPKKRNWLYNQSIRYLLESASVECARYVSAGSDRPRKMEVVFSHRKEFDYAQTSAYLELLRVRGGGGGRFNNLHSINWTTVSPYRLRSAKAKEESGLEFADCIASAIYRSLDENWFGSASPEFLQVLSAKFLRPVGAKSPKGYGFKLLPLNSRRIFRQARPTPWQRSDMIAWIWVSRLRLGTGSKAAARD